MPNKFDRYNQKGYIYLNNDLFKLILVVSIMFSGEFCLAMLREYGLATLLVIAIVFGYPHQVNKWAAKIIESKDREVDRIAKSRDALQKLILGNKHKSSLNNNNKEDDDE